MTTCETDKLMTHGQLLPLVRQQIHIDLYLPAGKRFKRSLDLSGEIDPDTSSVKVLGTKVCRMPASSLYF